ncbi:MAG: phosphonate metabolism protein/1,5-bisphosphokinase (PRPP-forming) PhnN [Gammaproteobacteria bacterium]|nr:phosphonate metabolism protein/1,5-bisphosphokinase (PRPP-forming) PhnN [Gammaproteobacteria bacterium]
MARLFYLCGPSGAGKNAVMAEAARLNPALRIAKRTITRPSDPSEQVETLSAAAFSRAVNDGDFLWWWTAHGLSYGIRHAECEGQGCVIVNGSRAYWPDAKRRVPEARLIVLTVDPEVLAGRLTARGRESHAAISERLRRNDRLQSDSLLDQAWLVLDNTRALPEVAQTLVRMLAC